VNNKEINLVKKKRRNKHPFRYSGILNLCCLYYCWDSRSKSRNGIWKTSCHSG